MSTEAALIIGVAVAVLNAILSVSGAGGFEDGIQLEDVVIILAPVLGAFGIRAEVFSKETVARDYRRK